MCERGVQEGKGGFSYFCLDRQPNLAGWERAVSRIVARIGKPILHVGVSYLPQTGDRICRRLTLQISGQSTYQSTYISEYQKVPIEFHQSARQRIIYFV